MHRYWKSGFQYGLFGHARVEIIFNDDGTLQLVFALHDDEFKVYSWYEVKGTWHEKNDIIYTTIEAVGEAFHEIYYLKDNCLAPMPCRVPDSWICERRHALFMARKIMLELFRPLKSTKPIKS
jgi:hypothetical protein